MMKEGGKYRAIKIINREEIRTRRKQLEPPWDEKAGTDLWKAKKWVTDQIDTTEMMTNNEKTHSQEKETFSSSLTIARGDAYG